MTVPTNVRAGRAAAIYAITQSAYGTPATDFTASGATRLWTEDSAIWVGPDVVTDPYMDDLQDDALYLAGDRPQGSFSVIGTYSSLKALLQSNYGTFASGTFTLATGITDTRWLTLAHVEDRFGAGTVTRKVVRLQDCWINRLSFEWSATDSKYLLVRAAYAGRKVLSQAQNAGGITFATAPMQPADKDLFPSSRVLLRRVVGRENHPLRFRGLRVTIDQGLGYDWDMGTDMYSVYKAGPCAAQIEFLADWCDETWTLLDLMRAGTKSKFIIDSPSEGGYDFRLILNGVTLQASPEVIAGQTQGPFRAIGNAVQVGSDFIIHVDLY